jgi:hypothetical protein
VCVRLTRSDLTERRGKGGTCLNHRLIYRLRSGVYRTSPPILSFLNLFALFDSDLLFSLIESRHIAAIRNEADCLV